MIPFTIFTPIYNRRDTIHRVFDSLCMQTFKDFEWIIIDDGSTDNVIEILEAYRGKADFPIRIFIQENQGKHIAWNRAVNESNGYLFIPADSDDSFEPDTLDFFWKKWNDLPVLERESFSGINVLCRDPENSTIVGDPFPSDGFISNNLELSYILKLKGEKWGCIRTELLKKYPYPDVKGRGSYILSYVWYALAKDFNVICFNKALRNFYQDVPSITRIPKDKINERRRKSAPTYVHFLTWHINANRNFLEKNVPKKLLFHIMQLIVNSIYMNRSIRDINRGLKFRMDQIVVTALYFPIYCYVHFSKR